MPVGTGIWSTVSFPVLREVGYHVDLEGNETTAEVDVLLGVELSIAEEKNPHDPPVDFPSSETSVSGTGSDGRRPEICAPAAVDNLSIEIVTVIQQTKTHKARRSEPKIEL